MANNPESSRNESGAAPTGPPRMPPPVRGGAWRADQAVLMLVQVVPFQKPVRPWPVWVLNLPWVPTATLLDAAAHSTPSRQPPRPAGGVIALAFHPEPSQVAVAGCASVPVFGG